MWFKKNKKILFNNKRFRIERKVKYRNPVRMQKGILKNKLFRIINIILLIGIISCLYFFIFSSFYNITNVEVRDNKIIATDDVLDIANNYLSRKRLGVLKNKNIFVFNKNRLKKEISEVVLVNDIVIEKILPNTIRLNFKEKDVALKWVVNDQEFLIDRQGIIIKRFFKSLTPKIYKLTEDFNQSDVQDDDEIKTLYNLNNEKVNLGDKVMNPEQVDFIFSILEELDEIAYVSINKINVPNNFAQYLEIETTGTWKIYFNFADKINSQIDRFKLLVTEKIGKGNLLGIDYIDLRLGENIYFKYK